VASSGGGVSVLVPHAVAVCGAGGVTVDGTVDGTVGATVDGTVDATVDGTVGGTAGGTVGNSNKRQESEHR
jgi:hypothetical protein